MEWTGRTGTVTVTLLLHHALSMPFLLLFIVVIGMVKFSAFDETDSCGMDLKDGLVCCMVTPVCVLITW